MALPFQGPLDPNTYASQLSARWASTSAHRGVFARLGPPQKRRTASDLAGTHFTQGRVADPQNQRYQDLLTARTIASRGTLHETHVNLESNIGQWLKANYDLPFQSHSRVDPMKAAVQAEKTFGEAGAKGGMALAPASEESLLTRAMQRYGAALSHFPGEIDRPIAAGVESMAVRMKSGNILKLSSETMEAGWGSRPFDVPILKQGTLPGATPVHYQIQPEVQIAKTPDESARFFGALKQAGYSVWDPGERQFGYYQGKAVLVDYSAVTARAGAPLKEIAQESLSRANIEGQAIGAAVRSPMEAAEKLVAKETLHELHVNLESGVGGWLKKTMRLPFKAKSRVDAMAAATQAEEVLGLSNDWFSGWLGSIADTAQRTLAEKHLTPFKSVLAPFAKEIEGFVGEGAQSLAVGLKGNRVLKIGKSTTMDMIQGGYGARPVDVPILAHGHIRTPGALAARQYVIQPRVQTLEGPEYTSAVAAFEESARSAGYSIVDPGGHQLGLYEGKVRVLDYPSVHVLKEGLYGQPVQKIGGAVNFTVEERETGFGVRRITSTRRKATLPTRTGAQYTQQESRRAETRELTQRYLSGEVPIEPGMKIEHQFRRDLTALKAKYFQRPAVVNRTAAASAPLQVAQEVHPSAALGAQTADKIAARETVNELHVRTGAPLKEIAEESLSRAGLEGKAIGAAVRSPMEAAEKLVAKETLHELHVNLESGVGGWLKKAMRLPFKAKSRVDPLKAALEGTSVVTTVSRMAAEEKVVATATDYRHPWWHSFENPTQQGYGFSVGEEVLFFNDLDRHWVPGKVIGFSLLEIEDTPGRRIGKFQPNGLSEWWEFGEDDNLGKVRPANLSDLSFKKGQTVEFYHPGAGRVRGVVAADTVVAANSTAVDYLELTGVPSYTDASGKQRFISGTRTFNPTLRVVTDAPEPIGVVPVTRAGNFVAPPISPGARTVSHMAAEEKAASTLGSGPPLRRGHAPTTSERGPSPEPQRAARAASAEEGVKVEETAAQKLSGKFSGKTLGIGLAVTAGVLTLGAALGAHHRQPESSQQRDSHSGGRERGETEARRERRRTRTVGRGQPSARTTMTIRDHPWDLAQVDSAFSRHTRTGYAYSPSTD